MDNSNMISVIVPIYNKEKYLVKCLNSIVEQTYKNLEIILVDDGSTDDSLKLCQQYAVKDNRIVVITKPNGGVSTARNFGLDSCTGNYISFVDPDDYLDLCCFELLQRCLDDTGADIAWCSIWNVSDNSTIKTTKSHETGEITVLDGEEYRCNRNLIINNLQVCSVIFREKIINKKRFDEDIYFGEDTLFLTKCIKEARKIVFLDKALYYYFRNSESVTRASYSEKKATEIIAWKRMYKLFEDDIRAYNTYKAAYAFRMRKNVREFCKDSNFSLDARDNLRDEFNLNCKYLVYDLLKNREFFMLGKVLFTRFFWNTWIKIKQTQ